MDQVSASNDVKLILHILKKKTVDLMLPEKFCNMALFAQLRS